MTISYRLRIIVCKRLETQIRTTSTCTRSHLKVGDKILGASRIKLTVLLSAEADTKKVEMTLRSGDLSKPVALTFSALAPGQHVDGVVKRIEEYGLFIQIDNSKLSGLCHKSQVGHFIFLPIHSNVHVIAFRQ